MMRATVRDQSYIELKFDTGLPVGSEVTFSLYLDQLADPPTDPPTYEPLDFAGKEFLCHLRKNLNSVAQDAVMTVTPRVAEPGWLDFYLDGVQSLAIGFGDFHLSAKMFPTGQPAQGRTFVVGVLPMRLFATR